jgi:acetyl esterase
MDWHPEMVKVHERIAVMMVGPADPLRQTLNEARQAAEAWWHPWNHVLVTIPEVVNAVVNGPAGLFPVRFFNPEPSGPPRGVIVYCHGGGYVINSLDTHDHIMRTLAVRSGLAVLGVGYSLAPEQRFPLQVDEVLCAMEWITEEAGFLSVIPEQFVLCGDSAGAHLALAVALHLQRRGGQPKPSALVLAYGMYRPELDTYSHACFGSGQYGLSTERMRWFWNAMRPIDACTPELFSTLTGDLSGLPKTLLVVGELDCLRDDSLLLHQSLARCGVHVNMIRVPGVPHSFLQFAQGLPVADQCLARIARFLSGGERRTPEFNR